MLYQLILRLWKDGDATVAASCVTSHLTALCPNTISTEQINYILGWFLHTRDGQEKADNLGTAHRGLEEEVLAYAASYQQHREANTHSTAIPTLLEGAKELLHL